jgi:EpsD family peptidyl-prolyl cis-trans isomerase
MWMTASAAALVMASCNSGGGDSGQGVLATVGSEKVTERQVDAELRLSGAQNPQDPALRKAALEQIVARKLLAQEARGEKLDKTAEGAVLRAAAIETYEANLERTAMMAKVPKPTPADATAFINAHPEMFAARAGYLIERLQVASPADPALIEALKPAKTLEEVEAVLQARKLPYRRTVDQLDTLRAAPQLTATLERLPPGEPFVLPEPGGFSVGRVRDKKVQPVTGEAATKIASELVYAQRQSSAMKSRLDALKAERVKYPDAKPAEKK